jgi:hypothetical protein
MDTLDQRVLDDFPIRAVLKAEKALLRKISVGMVCTDIACLMTQQVLGQTKDIPLNDLSVFQESAKSWQIAGDVKADLKKTNVLNVSQGRGILVNQPGRRNPGKDLYTSFEHGDIDLELEYMVAKGSNSGIYLQGQYEIQLEDSWGSRQITSARNGGIYERWDDSRPEGQKGYEGYAPRQNVSRAPGLRQHLKVSFQAARFNESGQKIENARILFVELNGVTIHEDVELFGPTRGAMNAKEKATGPLRLQGDHGAVAFRNIKMTEYGKPRAELKDLKYTVYRGRYEAEPVYDSLPPQAEGTSVILTSEISPFPSDFLIRYTGSIEIKEAGDYTFNLNAAGGRGLMRINGEEVISMQNRNPRGQVNLPAGNMPFELLYTKLVDWAAPSIGISVEGPGTREYVIGDIYSGSGGREPVDPILLDAPVNTMLRSFMDLPSADVNGENIRVVHAISVGSREQVHYTYDLDKGAIVQVWRGGFLDTTPMWHQRGDGSSRPVGAVQRFGQPLFSLAKLDSEQAAWITDTTGSGFRPKGYAVDDNDQPTFRYFIYGSSVEDQIRAMANGQGIRRELRIQNPSANLYARLAEGNAIEAVSKEMYLIDGKAYYIQLEDTEGAKPIVRNAGGRQELIIPVRSKLNYSILF